MRLYRQLKETIGSKKPLPAEEAIFKLFEIHNESTILEIMDTLTYYFSYGKKNTFWDFSFKNLDTNESYYAVPLTDIYHVDSILETIYTWHKWEYESIFELNGVPHKANWKDGTFKRWSRNKPSDWWKMADVTTDWVSKGTRDRRIDYLKRYLKGFRELSCYHKAKSFFSSNWRFQLHEEVGYISSCKIEDSLGMTRKNQPRQDWDKQLDKAVLRFKKKYSGKIKKTEKSINTRFHNLMATELPKINKLEEILENLIHVEIEYKNRFDELTARHERERERALEVQRLEFEERLVVAEKAREQQFLDMHEDIARQQTLVDNLFKQNELLLASQSGQVKGYGDDLLNLLEKLKNVS